MNPHQQARVIGGSMPRTLNGDPSYINYLDALNAFELVKDADAATGRPAASSFKHVSPAGAALAGDVDAVAAALWRVGNVEPSSLLSAYARARDADPKSSFGDVVALSRSVDTETAAFLRTVICDAVIAPGFEPGVVAELSAKQSGRFLVLEADTTTPREEKERQDVQGVTLEQQRDLVDVTTVLPDEGSFDPAARDDALLGLVVNRYTQSNSVALIRDGAAIGIGAGQQNRVDCVRLAGSKARIWWLRRHPVVDGLPVAEGMSRQDRLNWQIRLAGHDMTRSQRDDYTMIFGAEARERYDDTTWRDEHASMLTRVTLASDGYLPFRDNVEHAAEFGVTTIVEPGGSTRTPEVKEAARQFGMTHIETGLRLFHH